VLGVIEACWFYDHCTNDAGLGEHGGSKRGEGRAEPFRTAFSAEQGVRQPVVLERLLHIVRAGLFDSSHKGRVVPKNTIGFVTPNNSKTRDSADSNPYQTVKAAEKT